MDMYGEKVADASALIRQVSGKEYFDAFGVSTESVLELFIDCMEQVRKVEREAQAEHNANVVKMSHSIIDEQAARIADLERQLAEASAPAADVMMATAQRLIAEVNAGDEDEDEKNLTVRGIGWMHSELVKVMKDTTPSAPAVEQDKVICANLGELLLTRAQRKAADTDKVREAIRDVEVSTSGSKGYAKAFNDGAETMREAIAGIFDEMAAQAPVREVPGYKLVPIEPTPEMLTAAWNGGALGGEDDHVECWSLMLAAAPLPAAPVQQEGFTPTNKEQA